MARTISGKVITAVASVAPAVVKARRKPNQSLSGAPIGPLHAEQQQQDVAGDDRRQHERQVDESVDHALAGEAAPAQQPSDQDGDGQAEQDAIERDLEAEADGGPFLRVRVRKRPSSFKVS